MASSESLPGQNSKDAVERLVELNRDMERAMRRAIASECRNDRPAAGRNEQPPLDWTQDIATLIGVLGVVVCILFAVGWL